MKQELKIRIRNYKELEKQLQKLGAKPVFETYFVDTYFNAHEGEVLKIVESVKGARLVKFSANQGKFDIVSREKIENPEEKILQLKAEYGIDKILEGFRKGYLYKDFEITFNIIDNVGEFLIVVAENGQNEFIKNELGIENPEYITASFNKL